ncbi:MAG: N-acetyl-gamma-glutamyl-phosphate reductase [Bacteroidia bacterium]
MKNIKAGILGAAGYTGGELIRLLIHHPHTVLASLHSKSNAGNRVDEVHTDLLGDTDLRFSNELADDLDVLFMCLGHGDSKKFLAEHKLTASTRIIDLSQDFRWDTNWVYGLPELNREVIQKSGNHLANPGCFATCIQLALLPLADLAFLQSDIHINATTGSTGAGLTLSDTSHFSWRNNNLSAYKTFDHQHLTEINQSLLQLQPTFEKEIFFVPQRGNFTRGIHAVLYLDTFLSEEEAVQVFEKYYASHPFTHISKKEISLKQVVNTNKCFLHVAKKKNKLVLTSIIDNLLKGASGQAVQNMNIVFGLEETTGLQLKSTAF